MPLGLAEYPKWFGNLVLLILLILSVIFLFSQSYQCYPDFLFSFRYCRFVSRANGGFIEVYCPLGPAGRFHHYDAG